MKKVKFKILTVNQVLSQQEANRLIYWSATHTHKRALGDGSDYTGYNKVHIKDHWVRDTLNALECIAITEIRKETDQIVFPEMTTITEWPIGGIQEPHTDIYTNSEIESDNKDPNPSREWTAIVYLNTNYTGGRTYFPPSDYNSILYTHQPEPCQMILFQGIYHPHGVEQVFRNSRHTVAMWFTTNKDRILTDYITENLSLDQFTIRQ